MGSPVSLAEMALFQVSRPIGRAAHLLSATVSGAGKMMDISNVNKFSYKRALETDLEDYETCLRARWVCVATGLTMGRIWLLDTLDLFQHVSWERRWKRLQTHRQPLPSTFARPKSLWIPILMLTLLQPLQARTTMN